MKLIGLLGLPSAHHRGGLLRKELTLRGHSGHKGQGGKGERLRRDALLPFDSPRCQLLSQQSVSS